MCDAKHPSAVWSPAETMEAPNRVAAAATVKERTLFILYDVVFYGLGLEDGEGPLDVN